MLSKIIPTLLVSFILLILLPSVPFLLVGNRFLLIIHKH
jgi:hypothetical protein